MPLKGLLLNPVSALLLAGCAVPSAFAHADTFAWTNWSSATVGPPGSATGTIGSITVSYFGQTSGLTSVPSWTPASTFSGGAVGNAPPDAPSVQLEGTISGTPVISESITFSSAVVDPVIAIWSLGQFGDMASFDFSSKLPQIQGASAPRSASSAFSIPGIRNCSIIPTFTASSLPAVYLAIIPIGCALEMIAFFFRKASSAKSSAASFSKRSSRLTRPDNSNFTA